MRARQIRNSGTYPLTSTQMAAFNLNPATQLQKYRTAVCKTRTGQANTNVACLGDSTTLGVGALNVAGVGDLKPYAYPTQLMQKFRDDNINAHANSFFGFGRFPADINNSNSDARITFGVDWVGFVGTSLGGPMWQTPNTSTTPLSFTPTEEVDTFIIYYPTNTGLGTMAVDINGSTPVLQSTNAAVGVGSVTVSGTLGINTVNINFSSGSAGVYVIAVIAYNSSKKWVHIANMGWSASTASDIADTGTAYAPLNALGVYAPAITIIMDGINDWRNGVALSTYQTKIDAVIVKAQISGDVLLVTPIPSASTSVPIATQLGYVNVLKTLSLSRNVPLIDYYTQAGSWDNNQAMYTQLPTVDPLHYNMIGYNDVATTIYNVLGKV